MTGSLRAHRERYVQFAAAIGASAKTHFLETPIEMVRARIDQRNAKLPRFNFHIEPETMRGFEALFEIPSEIEGAEIVVVREFARPHLFHVQ